MGIYFEEEREKTRWDSGQATLHKEAVTDQKERKSQKDNEAYRVKNSYGMLRYLKKEKKKGGREGFAVEAFEAPGTPVHTEKEKHLDRRTMKKIQQDNKQTLFAAETPLRDQALFFDMRGGKKSADLISYMKELLRRQGHQTLEDTFGFLDQEPERIELETLKETLKSETLKSETLKSETLKSKTKESLTPEENETDRQMLSEERQEAASKRIDSLNSRLLRKEAKERQLCSELQLMLDQRTREEFLDGHQNLSQNEQESPRKDETKKRSDDPAQRRLSSDPERSEAAPEGEGADDEALDESDPANAIE